MRLGGRINTSQVEDRRGAGRGLAVGGGGLGVVGLIVALIFGLSGGGNGSNGDINEILRQLQPDAGAAQGDAQPLDCSTGASESTACFVTGVVNDVQATWAGIFQQQGRTYRETKLVLYTQATPTQGCGQANSAVGPFYCPGDEKVYLDLGFFQELRDRFGAPGDFAQAYVIAHEFGHHVQNLLGTMQKVDRVRQSDRSQANPLSVRPAPAAARRGARRACGWGATPSATPVSGPKGAPYNRIRRPSPRGAAPRRRSATT